MGGGGVIYKCRKEIDDNNMDDVYNNKDIDGIKIRCKSVHGNLCSEDPGC